MASHRELRDPIHGFIRVEGRERDIVDAPVFQRLRHVRQLAMAYLVYPAATHSRFEHTLGVLHVAGRMCKRLEIDGPHTQTIRFAALLHDVGHGSFSHPSESVLAELASSEIKSKAGGLDKIHELITRLIIRTDRELDKLLSEHEREQIIQLLDSGLDQPLYKQIVSGPLDADKQDYLLRDSYSCGVRYGVFDLERLHGVLNSENGADGLDLVVDGDGLHTLEQFVLARYFLTTQVIRHKIRKITDNMLIRGLKLGVREDKIGFLEKLYTFEETPEFCREYLSWHDERLVAELLATEYEATWAGRMARRLAERKLYKVVFARNLDQLSPTIGLSSPLLSVLPQIEGEVAQLMSEMSGQLVDANEVILDVVKAPALRKSEGSVLLRGAGGKRTSLESESVIFRSIDQSLQAQSLECYAPVTLRDESKRMQLEAKIADLIVARVEQLLMAPAKADEGGTQ